MIPDISETVRWRSEPPLPPSARAVCSSGLDVLCYAPDLSGFEAALREAFGGKPDFRWERQEVRGAVAGLVHFHSRGLPVEVTEAAFAQVLELSDDPYDRLWDLSWREEGVLVDLLPETADPG